MKMWMADEEIKKIIHDEEPRQLAQSVFCYMKNKNYVEKQFVMKTIVDYLIHKTSWSGISIRLFEDKLRTLLLLDYKKRQMNKNN